MSVASLDLGDIVLPDIEGDPGLPELESISKSGNGAHYISTKELFIGTNKRRDERRSASWDVVGSWCSGQSFEAITSNISASGLLMFTGKMAKVGDKAYLKIKGYVYGQTYEFDAVVVVKHSSLCRNHFTCGVEFIAIKKGSKQFIVDYVSGNSPFVLRELRNEKSIRELENEITQEMFDSEDIDMALESEKIDSPI